MYRGCPCWEPPSQPFCVLVGVVTSCVLCARVRGHVPRSCATENTYRSCEDTRKPKPPRIKNEKIKQIPARYVKKLRSESEVVGKAKKDGKIVPFANLNAELEKDLQKYKGRVVLRVDNATVEEGRRAVFTEQSASASQMTAAKLLELSQSFLVRVQKRVTQCQRTLRSQ